MGTINEPALYDLAGEQAIARAEAKSDYIVACADADMADPAYVADLFGDWNDPLQDKLVKMIMALRKEDEADALGYAYDVADELKAIAQKRVADRMGRA